MAESLLRGNSQVMEGGEAWYWKVKVQRVLCLCAAVEPQQQSQQRADRSL